jgi:hypothetical protein
MTGISASVGRGGVNIPQDVGIVQTLLNRHLPGLGIPAVTVNENADPRTIEAIEIFQRRVVKLNTIDGCVDPGGRTFRALVGATAREAVTATEVSGSAWWRANQARFPNSSSVSDLATPFRANVEAFIEALQAAGASVDVASTLRNRQRAYLMHFSWKIAKGLIAPADVPPEAGVEIVWNHGDLARSQAGAEAMVDLFGIRFQPSLTSLHLSGLAIDMDIGWSGTLNIRKKNGQSVAINAPRDGATNATLHTVGASYGVLKLLSDPPHWSSTGH